MNLTIYNYILGITDFLSLLVKAREHKLKCCICTFVPFSAGRRGRMVFGFTTTYVISAYHHERHEFEHHSGDVYSIQYYVIKFVSDLR